MGISRIPSPADELAPYLQKFGDELKNYLQPNKEFQKQMQKQLAENPELVLKFANLAAKSPDILARMGFSPNQQQFLGAAELETPEGELTRTTKPEIVAQGKAQIKAKTAESDVTATEATTLSQVMAENPQLTRDAALAQIRGPVTKDKLGQQQVEGNQRQLDLDTRRAALIKELPDMGRVDMVSEVKKFFAGDLSSAAAEAYQATPELKQVWSDAMTVVRDQNLLTARSLERKLAKQDTAADRIDGRRAQNAYMTWEKSKQVGTVDTWEAFMYDPKAQERAESLLSGKIKPVGMADEDLLAVAQSAQKSGAVRFNREVIAASRDVTNTLEMFREGVTDEERPNLIRQINEQLKIRARLTGETVVQAHWQDVSFRRDRLGFRTLDGKPIATEKIEEMLTNPLAGTLTPQQQTALARILELPEADRARAMAEFEGQDVVGTNAAAVRAELARRGELK